MLTGTPEKKTEGEENRRLVELLGGRSPRPAAGLAREQARFLKGERKPTNSYHRLEAFLISDDSQKWR
ncbi:MAG: hypothetical protein H6677_23805 [Candidatus Obscuribacterales bacterium]|nr:hypothetical protein [Cyanobacteria bacterium HKST-UBA01]MCB9471320.1 hypothetical protein [Candidatus Obscuribacterales bacterium]